MLLLGVCAGGFACYDERETFPVDEPPPSARSVLGEAVARGIGGEERHARENDCAALLDRVRGFQEAEAAAVIDVLERAWLRSQEDPGTGEGTALREVIDETRGRAA